jgi:hypothetical protein
MAVELNAGLVCDQRLKKRLALDERQARDVPAVEVQEIEGVIDEPHSALAVGGRLGVREARHPASWTLIDGLTVMRGRGESLPRGADDKSRSGAAGRPRRAQKGQSLSGRPPAAATISATVASSLLAAASARSYSSSPGLLFRSDEGDRLRRSARGRSPPQQSGGELASAVSATRASDAALSKLEDAAEVQLSSPPGPQPIQSRAASRHPAKLQAETLCCIGGVAGACTVGSRLREDVSRHPQATAVALTSPCPALRR